MLPLHSPFPSPSFFQHLLILLIMVLHVYPHVLNRFNKEFFTFQVLLSTYSTAFILPSMVYGYANNFFFFYYLFHFAYFFCFFLLLKIWRNLCFIFYCSYFMFIGTRVYTIFFLQQITVSFVFFFFLLQ